MYIVQILLPLFDNRGEPFSDGLMGEIREGLVAVFGGVTAFSRTPAEGVWSDHGRKIRDEIVLVEVMVQDLDPVWWRDFRIDLEKRLSQKSIVVRAFAIARM